MMAVATEELPSVSTKTSFRVVDPELLNAQLKADEEMGYPGDPSIIFSGAPTITSEFAMTADAGKWFAALSAFQPTGRYVGN